MKDVIKILGIEVNTLTMKETLDWVEKAIQQKKPTHIITANPEMIMMAQNNNKFFEIMNKADLIVPDGIGLLLAAKYFIGQEFPERVTGFDLSMNIFEIAKKKGYSIYLLGGEPGVSKKAAQTLQARFSGLHICGHHHGYFDITDCEEIIDEISSLKPDILFVGMGAPRQEFFIADYKDKYQAPISIGIGGSIDIWAGNKKRAPKIMLDLHLEWFYRLVKEPTRFIRMLALPKFVYYAARYKGSRLS